MSITTVWEVNKVERILSDGFVEKVIYRVKGLSDGKELSRSVGSVLLEKPSSLPSDFIAYESLKASDCLTWVKDTLGATKVSEIETSLTEEVSSIVTPVKAEGRPWV
tara:strand:- start:437 stop:757 length:321 start_codon:yes stop_codon:yes gene_type:complete